MNKEYDICAAERADAGAVVELLMASDLPTVNVIEQMDNFLIAKDQEIIGALGVLYKDKSALLRSFVVAPKRRKKGIGLSLVNGMLHKIKKQGMTEVFLLTETAADYFIKVGFTEIKRAEIPETLLKESGLDRACPCSSRCFILKI